MKKILSCLFTAIIGVSMVSCLLPIISTAGNDPIEDEIYTEKNPLIKVGKRQSSLEKFGFKIKGKKENLNQHESTIKTDEYKPKKCSPSSDKIKPKKEIIKSIVNEDAGSQKKETSNGIPINEISPLYRNYILSSNSLSGPIWTDPTLRFNN